jgi:hypothetical protein
MKLPNAQDAIIAPEKLRDYLLNPAHRRGGPKSRVLRAMGYEAQNWPQLEADLRSQHLSADIESEELTDYGWRYVIQTALTGPRGHAVIFYSVWQIDLGSDRPRLVTMYPE